MKTKIILASFLAIVLGMSSCTKEKITQDEIVKEIGAAKILNPNGSPLFVLTPENGEGAFERIVWEAAYYGEDVVDISYEIQIDNSEGDFSNPQSLTPTTDLFSVIKVSEANDLFLALGIATNVETSIQIRVVSTAGGDEKISSSVSMVVNRYVQDGESALWGVKGTSAWENDYAPLIYNETEAVWKATMPLNDGVFKFESPTYLGVVLGDDDDNSTTSLVVDGKEIATVGGIYTVTLDVINNSYALVAATFPANLYAAGDFQGWDAGNAAPLRVEKLGAFATGVYDMYIDNASGFGFKFLEEQAWAAEWADDKNDSGHLVSSDGANISVPEAGFWFVEANLASQTWKVTKTNWGIIGDATPGGWDAQTDFTLFDAATNTFTMEADLLGGKELKFRGTDDWSVNYGGNGLVGDVIPGGDNIKIIDDGSYVISLVLTNGSSYTYSIVKK